MSINKTMDGLKANISKAVSRKVKTLTYISYSRKNAFELGEELDRLGFDVTINKTNVFEIVINLGNLPDGFGE